MLIDTHLHLSDPHFDADRDAVIERAQQAGVSTFIEIAESPDSWQAALALAERHPFFFASLGIHPHHAHRYGPAEWPALEERLRRYFENPKAVAVGEFGLDYFRMENSKEEQRFLFRAQLQLARSLGKPVVIHCRESEAPKLGETPSRAPGESAHADVQAALEEFFPETTLSARVPAPPGVIHCFSGTWSDAQTYFLRGFLVGIDGPLTYPSSKLLQQNVTRMPLERIVLETDAPYLPPQAHRGRRNEPAYLAVVAEQVAALKHKSLDETAAQTTRNAQALFRLPN